MTKSSTSIIQVWYNLAVHRALVPEGLMAQKKVTLPPDAARHLKVVRPRPGEEIELFDGQGRTRRYRWDGRELLAVGETAAFPRLPVRLTLFACVTKGSRWDWTIEKAVELGATQIIPVLSARCIVRLTTAERAAKAERWRRIAADAARQSDAVWLPEVREAVEFAEAVELAKGHGRVFAGALTDPPPPPIWREVAAALQENCRALGVFVGPEGDFTPEELHALLEVAKPVSFGPTILRDETAAIFGLSVLAAAIQSCPTVATESSLTGL